MLPILDFLEWYYLRAPKSHLILAKNICQSIEDSFGIITNLVYFFKPWYGDRSFIGRTLSLIVRIVMILTGSLTLVIIGTILYLFPLLWIGASIVIPWVPEIVIVPLVALVYYLLIGIQKSKVVYPYRTKPHRIEDAMTGSALQLLNLHGTRLFFKDLIQTSKVTRFMIKTQLPFQEILDTLHAHTSLVSTAQLRARLYEIAITHQIRTIRAPHVLCALMYEHTDLLQPVLEAKRLSIKNLANYIEWDEYEYLRARPPQRFDPDYYAYSGGGTNRAHLGVVTPALNEVSVDFTREAARNRHELRIVRTTLIDQIEQILQKKENANVILKGEKGSGKESIIWQIAQLILLGKFKNALWSKRIISIDIAALAARGAQVGLETYVAQIRAEIRRSKNIILYLSDIQSALEQSKAHGTNIITMIEELVMMRESSVILTCTPQEYSMLKSNNPRLIQLSEEIDIPETNTLETLQIAHLHSLQLEQNYDVIIPYPSLELCVNFSRDYIHNAPFPQKALTLLEDTIIAATRSDEARTRTPWGPRLIIVEKHLARTLTEKTHIPVGTVTRKEADVLLTLGQNMRARIAAQDHAIESIVGVLQRNRAGVRTQTRPIGSFLFAGPTGVGKTHVAKTLAELYFGSEDTMIRLDMSEYQTQESIHRLTSREPGSLVEHVRNMPFSLVLLDEVEKAHPQILDLFLQILDDARLTDENGSTCDFTQTVIIATTNAGNTELNEIPHDHTYFAQAAKILQKYFRTEFLNRFDDIIAFEQLNQASLSKIVELKLKALATKLYDEKKITIDVTPQTREWLATFGYSPELGARNLNRLLQDSIETKLAQKILAGEVKEGMSIQI